MFRITHDQISNLFDLYKKTGNRYSYIKYALELKYDLDQDQLTLIWQGFDRAAEEWQKSDYE